jgi:hypothetical protein
MVWRELEKGSNDNDKNRSMFQRMLPALAMGCGTARLARTFQSSGECGVATHVHAVDVAVALTLHKPQHLTTHRPRVGVMASSACEYTPLTSDTSFCLCRLLNPPTVSSDIFAIEIFEASREHPPLFEAISYAWVSGSLACTIFCNGQLLCVSLIIVDFFHDLRRQSPVGRFGSTLFVSAKPPSQKRIHKFRKCAPSIVKRRRSGSG